MGLKLVLPWQSSQIYLPEGCIYKYKIAWKIGCSFDCATLILFMFETSSFDGSIVSKKEYQCG